jgi:hypothetical protein
LRARATAAFKEKEESVAYTRGETYIWSDGEHLHIWADTGMDDWAQMERYQDMPDASGVQISEPLADELAVMRFAELLASGDVADVVTRALTNWKGNSGCLALERFAAQLSDLRCRE